MFYHRYAGPVLVGGQKAGRTDRSGRRDYARKSVGALLLVAVLLGAMAAPALAAGASDVSYPVNMFDNGKAHHFEYKTGDGVTVRYFVMKSSDGVIRAAFDACNVCWREGKGYTQKDDVMVCNNCGRRFPSTKINVVTGGCNPVALTRNTEGGKVVIKAEHILEGKRYFALRGGR
ncbi:MAG: Fe-S-containing protein [Syntrophales bacterium]